MRLNDFGEQRPGEYCTYPAVLERFIIPRNARETHRGWVWTDAYEYGPWTDGGQAIHVYIVVLPRCIVTHEQRGTRTIVTLPAHYAEWHGIETIEERARQREGSAWNDYRFEAEVSAHFLEDVDARYCADSADRYEGN